MLTAGRGVACTAHGKAQSLCNPNPQGLAWMGGWMEAMENIFGTASGLLGARSDF